MVTYLRGTQIGCRIDHYFRAPGPHDGVKKEAWWKRGRQRLKYENIRGKQGQDMVRVKAPIGRPNGSHIGAPCCQPKSTSPAMRLKQDRANHETLIGRLSLYTLQRSPTGAQEYLTASCSICHVAEPTPKASQSQVVKKSSCTQFNQMPNLRIN